MRMMLRVSIDAHDGSKAIKAGLLPQTIANFMEKFKPEAAYFAEYNGEREGVYVFDMSSPDQRIGISEPFYDLGCKINLFPCMSLEDLKVGLASIQA